MVFPFYGQYFYNCAQKVQRQNYLSQLCSYNIIVVNTLLIFYKYIYLIIHMYIYQERGSKKTSYCFTLAPEISCDIE